MLDALTPLDKTDDYWVCVGRRLRFENQGSCFRSEEFKEGIQSFVERRAAAFRGKWAYPRGMLSLFDHQELKDLIWVV
jgi:hypothetical protein